MAVIFEVSFESIFSSVLRDIFFSGVINHMNSVLDKANKFNTEAQLNCFGLGMGYCFALD